MSRAIGGFFALEPGSERQDRSLLALWQADAAGALAFRTARAAIRHVVQTLAPPTLWSPAYMCPEVTQVVAGLATRIRYFPICEDLSPNIGVLRREVRPGDAVLAVDYFGRNPNDEFLSFVSERPEIVWIEDRAQALLSASTPWGHYVVYSPRKLLGVPDGGIVVSRHPSSLNEPAWVDGLDVTFMAPSLLRLEDRDEAKNDVWHRAHTITEAALTADFHRMSALAASILRATAPEPLIARRRRNYALLDASLRELALFADGFGTGVPFGYPVRLPGRRDAVARRLANRRIFAPRFWLNLPAPAEQFRLEHALAAELLVLPCDHRYGDDETAFMVHELTEML